MVRNLDAYCSKDHSPSNNTTLKVQTQGIIGKKSKPEESRPKKTKLAEGKNPAPPRSKFTEPRKTSRIDKKSEYLEKKKKRDQKNNTPVTGDNANAVEIDEKKKQDNWGDKRYYNCQKKGHFSRNCPEPPKN